MLYEVITDEGTAEELQARARDYIEAQNAKAIAAAKEMGVEQSLFDFEGLTPQMIEALAKDGIKTLEDFATCADWELAGGWTTVDGARVKDDGILEKFDLVITSYSIHYTKLYDVPDVSKCQL